MLCEEYLINIEANANNLGWDRGYRVIGLVKTFVPTTSVFGVIGWDFPERKYIGQSFCVMHLVFCACRRATSYFGGRLVALPM